MKKTLFLLGINNVATMFAINLYMLRQIINNIVFLNQNVNREMILFTEYPIIWQTVFSSIDAILLRPLAILYFHKLACIVIYFNFAF